MDKVNVLIASWLDPGINFMEKIAAVDPRVSLKNGMAPLVKELRRAGSKHPLLDMMERIAEENSDSAGAQEDLDSLLAEAEVMFGLIMLPENLLARAPKLKWLHLGNTGMEGYRPSGIFESNITVTNSKGSQAIAIAEYCIAYMFMFSKHIRQLLENQKNHHWDAFISNELRDQTVGLIGLGAIGKEVASLAKGVGMRVIATKRSATKHESGVQGVDELYPLSDLHQMLSESDFVVIAVPLTPETTRMFGEAELRAMKPSAHLINVARGEVADQATLTRALKEKWIASAGLDVFEVEPLPKESELWDLPNVFVSSHATGAANRRGERVLDMFCDNLKRYLAGEQVFNIVDLEKGY